MLVREQDEGMKHQTPLGSESHAVFTAGHLGLEGGEMWRMLECDDQLSMSTTPTETLL